MARAWIFAMLAILAFSAGRAEAKYFKACYGEVSIRLGTSFRDAKVGSIPAEVEVEALNETGLWIRVHYNGLEGWAAAIDMCPVEDAKEEEALLYLHYKSVHEKGRYRHYFGFYNTAVDIFTGKVRANLYNGDRLIYSGLMDFSIDRINPNYGRAFQVETDEEMTGYTFEVLGWKSRVNPYY